MYLIRDVFRCKPGKAAELAERFKKTLPSMRDVDGFRGCQILVDAVATAIKDTTGVDAALSTSGGTSDGRFIADICPQVIEIGPLNATIHKLNECVAVDDLDALSEIYYLTLVRLLAK